MCKHRRPRAEMIEVAERIDTHNAPRLGARGQRSRYSRCFVRAVYIVAGSRVRTGVYPPLSELCVHWLFSRRQHIV